MEIIVTGATGVLGCSVVPRCVANGHHVRALARSPANAETVRGLGAEPVTFDLFDRQCVQEAVAGSEVVLHLATKIPPTNQLRKDSAWTENDRIRREGTHNLIEAALFHKVQRFVYPSVTLEYPDSEQQWIDATTTA